MRNYWFIAAIAALALTSCVQEKSFQEDGLAGENDMAFVLQGGASTRAGEEISPVRRGEIIPVTKVDGIEIFMEETIATLGASGAETRGMPVFTENIGYIQGMEVGVNARNIDANYVSLGDAPLPGGWRFHFLYDPEIWPDAGTPVDFHLRAPYDMKATKTTDGTTTTTYAHGVTSLSFSSGVTTVGYTSPTTAEETTDLLFGAKKMSKTEYLGYRKNDGGAKVILYHALSGVKFAIANDAAEAAKIQIHTITFTGLKNTGSFTFNDTATPKINWTSATTTSDTNVISQDFGEAGEMITYSSDENPNKFGPTFYDGGTDQNINDAKASKTFWMVPQLIDDKSPAKLKIEYTINGTDEWFEIDLKDLYKANGKTSDWKAGELRTYTFQINQVNVKIQDKVTVDGDEDDGYSGSVKDQVTITNTGNTNAFIRAALVGQWLDENGDPVFGFTDKINKLYLVESWYEDQFGKNAEHNHGEFVGLAGNKENTENTTGDNPYKDWVLCKDGYYYYTKAVAPEGTTSALFSSYKVLDMPEAEIGGVVLPGKTMHFTLEISTQAIAANQLDGKVKQTGEGEDKTDDWASAWAKILGSAPQKK